MSVPSIFNGLWSVECENFPTAERKSGSGKKREEPTSKCATLDFLFFFIILLKFLIAMLFINILLLFLYKVDSYESTSESTSRVYGTITSLHKLSSLITLIITQHSPKFLWTVQTIPQCTYCMPFTLFKNSSLILRDEKHRSSNNGCVSTCEYTLEDVSHWV